MNLNFSLIKSAFLFWCFLVNLLAAKATILHVGVAHRYTNIKQAAEVAKPGDTILCDDAIITGGIKISNLHGKEGNYIYLLANKNKTVTIRGGSSGIHFSDCSYLHIEGFTFEGQTANGLNIDDGSTIDSPAHHLRIFHCIFRNILANGNNDLLKLSGLDHFEISNSSFLNGAARGSGIDMVGCHYGVIADNSFENLGSNAIQAKGGSFEIDILRNHIKNGGARAMNLGGSTGLQFFRPQNATTEAERISVIANVIEGSETAIAYVGCTQVQVYNNTILFPTKWVIRILQETVNADRFLPAGNNEFFNNIVLIDDKVSTEVSTGPNTNANSFSFENNIWYKITDSQWQGPPLAGNVAKQLVKDPLLVSGSLYKIDQTSPAAGYGKLHNGVVLDKEGKEYKTPPSVGAYETNRKSN